MFQFVVFGLLFSALAINVSPLNIFTLPVHVTVHPVDETVRPVDVSVAAMARRLVHQANWASVATISSDPENPGYPMVNLLSTADSKVGAHSTGEIYFYMMGVDTVSKDVKKSNKISFMFTDAQEGVCNKFNVDPWSHGCPRAIISGEVKPLEEGTDEYTRGLEAFISRHPTAASWSNIPGHAFYFCKLDIKDVMVFTMYGYKHITVPEYFAADKKIIGTMFSGH